MKSILRIESTPEMDNYIPTEKEIRKFFLKEKKLLQKVENFLRSENSNDYSQFDNEIAFGLLHVANLTFWISTNFKICALLYSTNSVYNDNPSLANSCNTRFNKLVSEFNFFKDKIAYFFNMATRYGQTYGNDISQIIFWRGRTLFSSSKYVTL